ncbi:unnamed protein product (macronuclear) [Paramecium tetraurelia]|uniref:Uncharacterized protein n=1 Tax=Paramecium tetraurelia TaxID=5888 RepID=A0C798_PARTE|nr:uncharacterized protein GSPATT00035795001 [Paramecium tetraurelia]CAK66665.1 unnamed protein product [Paramecium tetraurelia]|eukprot:XP_001434062.1 hypothetical protein (macronuclear) [Paramecium tetraurelia strain d4-2]
MNKLKQEYQTKEDSKNNKTTNNQINLSVEKQLSKIYKQKDNCMLCISCQQDIMRQNIYNHIFEPLHILKLQEYFIQQSSNAQNKREKIQKKVDRKTQSFQTQYIKNEQIGKEDKKHQTIEIPQIDQELNQNINRNQIERFVEILQYDLKCIGKIQLSLIVSILVKTYCTINEIIEMKFSQILDKCTFYYININNSWEKSYLILKQRFPEYLQDFMSRNLGSNKHLIKLLGQNKRQTLSKELWLSCNKIQSQTTDAEYISFLQGLTLKKLKKISLEKMAKKNKIQVQDEQITKEITQKNQAQSKNQDFQKIEQIKNPEKKQAIKIIIKQRSIENQKQELVD